MTRSLTLIAVALAAGAGCDSAADLAPQPCHIAEYGDLRACLQSSKDSVAVGAPVTLTLQVWNRSDEPMTIEAPSAAKVVATVWAYRDGRWRRIDEYPEMAAAVMTPWELAPDGPREFHLTLYPQPDWPTHEQLKVAAELHGRPDVRPFVWLTVTPQDSP